MVGKRIKQARLEMGISQQQLAGTQLSRSFICRVEKGLVRPSLTTLKLIAQRLGKPVEYFTMDEGAREDWARTGLFLTRAVKSALKERDRDKALEAARSLVSLSKTLTDVDAELRAELALLKVYEQFGLRDQAIEIGEELYERCRVTGNVPHILAEACLRVGAVYLALADFKAAQRYFNRVLKYARESKSLIEWQTRAHIGLGSCFFRVGLLDKAAASYRFALDLCDLGLSPELRGLAKLGLGWLLHKQGKSEEARQVTQGALDVLDLVDHPAAVYAQHNLAIIEGAQHRWDLALKLLRSCLQVYEQRGEPDKKASVLEELARYYLLHNDPAVAQNFCEQAMALLHQQDDSVLRGRLWRLAAQIQEAVGNYQRAKDLALVSLEVLRRLGAQEESAATEAWLSYLDQK